MISNNCLFVHRSGIKAKTFSWIYWCKSREMRKRTGLCVHIYQRKSNSFLKKNWNWKRFVRKLKIWPLLKHKISPATYILPFLYRECFQWIWKWYFLYVLKADYFATYFSLPDKVARQANTIASQLVFAMNWLSTFKKKIFEGVFVRERFSA